MRALAPRVLASSASSHPGRFMIARSLLYVPGDRADRVAKAFASAGDAVIVDLEDSVKPDRKVLARNMFAREVLARGAGVRRGATELWVRINSGDEGIADLDALAEVGPDGATAFGHIDGIVVAKSESAGWLDHIAGVVAAARTDQHRADVTLAPLIESARGLRSVDAIAAHPAVSRLHLGEVDLAADLGVRLPGGQSVLDAARVALVVASAAAGLVGPVGGVHLQIDDLDALATTSRALADCGFGGRAVIHPSHCTGANEAFAPSDADREWATDVIARLAAATGGAVRAADGSMLDEAVARRARTILARSC